MYAYTPETPTFRIDAPDGKVRFLKLAPTVLSPGVPDECRRMRWAQDYLPVPRVIECGSDGGISWLLTESLNGSDATDPRWKAEPERLVRLLALGLRQFHEAPVSECPFDFRLEVALGHVRNRVETGVIDPKEHFHPEFREFTPRNALEYLEQNRPTTEDLVVCHGDYCFPNVLIKDWGIDGFLDLSELGVADRWWDLAVATWSITWNIGPGLEHVFLEAYGIEEDPDRIGFYRLLYDLAS